MDLIDAIIKKNIELVRSLLEQGSDPNYAQDDEGITPLHFAVLSNSLEIVELLYTAGANLDCETDEGESPLDLAKELKNKKMIALLIRLKHYKSNLTSQDQ